MSACGAAATSSAEGDRTADLDRVQAVAAFHEEGYTVCPALLSGEHIAALERDFNDYIQQAGFSEWHGSETGEFEASSTARLSQPTESPVLGALSTYPPLVAHIAALMEANCNVNPDALPTFSLHHQHALRSLPGDTGSNW
eukprot:COSAG02_NODE_5243_length_4508_cov_334.963484_3_plen_141_part_00